MGRKEARKSEIPVIHDLFPVSAGASTEAVEATVKAFSNERTMMAALRTLNSENPAVTVLLRAQMAINGFVKDDMEAMMAEIMLGSIYGYEALKREAQVRGGKIPVINGSQVRTYLGDYGGVGRRPNLEVVDVRREIERTASAGITLNMKMLELRTNEPHYVGGFEMLMRRLEVDDVVQERAVFGSAFQMHAIFKTNSEIEKVRRLAQ